MQGEGGRYSGDRIAPLIPLINHSRPSGPDVSMEHDDDTNRVSMDSDSRGWTC